MCRKMMFLLLVITLVFDLGNFALIPVTKQDNSVRSCIKRIIDVYADNATTVLSIYGDFTRGNFLPRPMQVPMINIDVNQKVYNLNYQPRRELVIIDPFGYDFDEIRILGFWNDADLSKRKFVFVIDVISRPILDLLRYLWRIDIIDVIFLVNKSRSSFTEVVVGNKFHPSNKCGSVVATMLASSCDRIKNRKQKFFRNYSKCNLTYLYTMLFQNANNNLYYITEFVLSEIAATLNLSLSKKSEEAAITNNDHYLLFLINMRFCGHKSKFCGEAFTKNVHVWTVPSPKKLGPIEVFKLIFKWDTWILIFLSFIITCFVWWAISTCIRSTSFSSTIFDLCSITLTGAINRVPMGFSLRCLFLSYVIYSIHIQAGFTCNLVKLLTVPQYSVIKTIEELADSDLPILVPADAAVIVLNMTHENNKIFEKLKNKFHVLSTEEWRESHINLQLLENSSILTGIMNIYSLVKEFQRKIYFIPDETLIRSELMTFGTRPSSYLIQDVNNVINSLREAGLLDYQKIIYKRTQKEYNRYYEETQDSTENVILGIEHVYPIFLFWGAGMVIATVIFVLEHVTYNIKNR